MNQLFIPKEARQLTFICSVCCFVFLWIQIPNPALAQKGNNVEGSQIQNTISQISDAYGASIDPSTGKANITYQLAALVGTGVQVPVSVGYQTGGIKRTDVASGVGLGWNLNSGGMIRRRVRGFPDYLYPADSDTDPDYQIYHRPFEYDLNNFYHSSYVLTAGEERTQSAYKVNNPDTYKDVSNLDQVSKYDGGSDLYTYEFPGGRGEFMINNSGRIINLTNNGLKIFFVYEGEDTPTTGGYWTIKDKSGNAFHFGRQVKNRCKESVFTKVTQAERVDDKFVNDFRSTDQWRTLYNDVHMIWMLDEMKSASSNDIIEITYSSKDVVFTKDDYFLEIQNKVAHIDRSVPFSATHHIVPCGYMYDGDCSYPPAFNLKKNTTRSLYKQFVPVEMVLREKSKIVLSYESKNAPSNSISNKYDDYECLTRIEQYKWVSNVWKRTDCTNLTYGWFSTEGTIMARPKLAKISRTNNHFETKVLFEFEYHEPSNTTCVPYTAFYDHWGYFNGDGTPYPYASFGIPLCTYANLNPFENRQEGADFIFGQNQSQMGYLNQQSKEPLLASCLSYGLKKIHSIGGGNIELKYELNTAMVPNYSTSNTDLKVVGGLRVKELKSEASGSVHRVGFLYKDYDHRNATTTSGKLYSNILSYVNETYVTREYYSAISVLCSDYQFSYDYLFNITSTPSNEIFDHEGNHIRYEHACVYEADGSLGYTEITYFGYDDLYAPGSTFLTASESKVLRSTGQGVTTPPRRTTGKYAPLNWWKPFGSWGHMLGLTKLTRVLTANGTEKVRTTNHYTEHEFWYAGPIVNFDVRNLVQNGREDFDPEVMGQYFTKSMILMRYCRLDKTETLMQFSNGTQNLITDTYFYRTDFPGIIKRKETKTSLGDRIVFEESRLAIDLYGEEWPMASADNELASTIHCSREINSGTDPIETISGYLQGGNQYVTGASYLLKRFVYRKIPQGASGNKSLLPFVAGTFTYDESAHVPVISSTYSLKWAKPILYTDGLGANGTYTSLALQNGVVVSDSRMRQISKVISYDLYFNVAEVEDYYGQRTSFKLGRNGSVSSISEIKGPLSGAGILNFESEWNNIREEKFYFPEEVIAPGQGHAYYKTADAFTGMQACLVSYGNSPGLLLKQTNAEDAAKEVEASVWVKRKSGTGQGTLKIRFGNETPTSQIFTAGDDWTLITMKATAPQTVTLPYTIECHIENDRRVEGQPENDLLIDDLKMTKAGVDVLVYGYDEMGRTTSVTDINHKVIRQEYSTWGEPTVSRDHKGDIIKLEVNFLRPR